MKKLIAILCTVLCIFSLTACSESAEDQTKAARKEYIDNQKLTSIEQLFTGYLNIINYLVEERELQAGEELLNYEAMAVMSNDEVESIMSQFADVDGHGFKTALESFHLSQKNTGKLLTDEMTGEVLVSNYHTVVNGDQILAQATVKCEKGDADVELIFSNDLLLQFKGGSLNAKSSFGELMEKAGLNTLIGMGTVFAVLILISLIIACFGFIPKIQAAFAKKEEVPEAPAAPAVVQTAPEAPAEEEDDTELVAVIAAAIAAYEGSTNTEGFVVRSIRRRF